MTWKIVQERIIIGWHLTRSDSSSTDQDRVIGLHDWVVQHFTRSNDFDTISKIGQDRIIGLHNLIVQHFTRSNGLNTINQIGQERVIMPQRPKWFDTLSGPMVYEDIYIGPI